MRENKYDDPAFFLNYSRMPRSVDGLDAAGEWPVLRAMLPDLQGKRVLDLGCGFGWHCRYAREQGARSVLGIDISARMLERARADTHDPAIEYRREAIEDSDWAADSFDVALSSLALHYIADVAQVYRKVHRGLAAGGEFVFSIEHPMVTARAAQDWHYGQQGERLHWPVDDYQQEGARRTRFLDNDVVKYHRTLATLINGLIDAGFQIRRVAEPQPSEELLALHPDWRDELRRPLFLLIAAQKG